MAQTTEAACLLGSGVQYFRRLGLRPCPDRLVFVGIKRGAFSLYFDDEPIYHFDLEGRWQRAFVAGTHYRKALDGSVDAIDRPREGASLVLRRRALSYAEAADLDASIRSAVLDVVEGLGVGRWEAVAPTPGDVAMAPGEMCELLDRAARWDAAAWFALREKYLATYGPIPFLPPDCHQAVVLQATLGHAAGLAFGNGPAAEHYVRSPDEFARHVRAVAALLGRRVLQCNGVFLAGSDVLRRPIDDIEAYLAAITEVFPLGAAPARRLRDLPENEPQLEGVDAFLDDFRPPLPDEAGWRRLAVRGLRRVNLGGESGDPEVLRTYGKKWEPEELRPVVASLKGAGLAVRVVTLVGAGGESLAERHASATADLMNSLDLGRGDLVYLVDANEVGDVAAREPSIVPLVGPAWHAQQADMKERLNPVKAKGAKLPPYSLEKQYH
jgi:hypothetical protein